MKFRSSRLTHALSLLALLALVAGATGAYFLRRNRTKGPATGERAFYYWRTTWAPTATERRAIEELGITKLYLRFFDVSWSATGRAPRPQGTLRIASGFPGTLRVVPVVYLENAVFRSSTIGASERLADNVFGKVNAIAESHRLPFSEIQLDCDWSLETKARYFAFLRRIGVLSHTAGKIVSATIRLHQVKYAGLTGIPPVNRGMLMFYNMGKVSAPQGSRIKPNSIFNPDDARRYLIGLDTYPLDLDLVLPIFSWGVHSRGDSVVGLIEKTPPSTLASSGGFEKTSPSVYTASASFFLHGTYFRKGDLVAWERISPADTRAAASLVFQTAGTRRFKSIAFFDLDERNLDGHSTRDLGNVFASFN